MVVLLICAAYSLLVFLLHRLLFLFRSAATLSRLRFSSDEQIGCLFLIVPFFIVSFFNELFFSASSSPTNTKEFTSVVETHFQRNFKHFAVLIILSVRFF